MPTVEGNVSRLRGRWQAYRVDAIDPRIYVIRQLPLAGGRLLGWLAVLHVVLGTLPVAFILATSILVGRIPAVVDGGVGSAEWDGLVTMFVLASAAFLARQLLAAYVTYLGLVLKHRVDGRFRQRLIDASLRSTGIGVLEDEAALDALRQAAENLRTNARSPGDAAMGTLAYLTRYTELAGYLAILGFVGSWAAATAVAVVTMLFRYGHRGGLRISTRLWPKLSSIRRRRTYFGDLGTQAVTAKEMRIFGLSGWVIEQFRQSAQAALTPVWAERRRTNVVRFLYFTAAGLLVLAVALGFLVRSAALGALTLPELVLVLQAAIAATILGDYYHEADDRAQFGMIAAHALEDFDRKVTAFAADDVRATGDADATGFPAREIRFERVSFTYAAGHRPVIDELDLTLRAGECTAVVGLNGAGKTTLVKLLARLHEPTAGRLTVDGADLRTFDVTSWRRQIGVIFQDFNRYQCSAADNIAFGAIERPVDGAAVRDAAEKAGIAVALDALPDGMHTLLTRQYERGAELSGGQWQRVAIARALYAVDAGARVLVLDEPTAALDAEAEHALFERYASNARLIGRQTGAITVLVSHRFSTVRMADRIVVVDDGRIAETGSHDELMAKGGLYAGLYAVQAHAFRAVRHEERMSPR